ncbi:MAG: lysophospholipid acyltransferase family protein [Holophagaceae bacterium]
MNWRSNLLFSSLLAFWGIFSLVGIIFCIFISCPFVGRIRSFWFWAPKFYKLVFIPGGIDVETFDRHKIPRDVLQGSQPAIFMSNHETQLDPPLYIGVCPPGTTIIVKKELAWIPFLGFAAWAANAIFIDRSNSEKARISIDRAIARIRNGQSVFMYPEGTRTRTGDLMPFKKGGFVMAMQSQVPIIPSSMTGGFRILPPGSLRIRPGKIIIRFGEPIWPKNFQNADDLLRAVHQSIKSMIEQDKSRL